MPESREIRKGRRLSKLRLDASIPLVQTWIAFDAHDVLVDDPFAFNNSCTVANRSRATAGFVIWQDYIHVAFRAKVRQVSAEGLGESNGMPCHTLTTQPPSENGKGESRRW